MPTRNPLKSARERYSKWKTKDEEEMRYFEEEQMAQTSRVKEKEARLEARKQILERKKQELELRKQQREIKRQEREERYPTGTKVYRRAEQMVGLGVQQAEKLPANVAMEGASRLQRSAGRVSITPTTTRLPRDRTGRTRLPVFAEGQPGFAERIAMDFGMNKQQDILGSQQQKDVTGQPKVIDFGFGNKQYDLGIGSSNGKKKKEVRYY